MTDLLFNYGISTLVLVTIIFTGIIFYKIGYLLGHQNGWREGLYRGRQFGRMKILEQEGQNGRRSL